MSNWSPIYVIYTRPDCVFCNDLKSYFAEFNQPYEEHEATPEVLQKLRDEQRIPMARQQLPLVFSKSTGEFIGSVDQTKEAILLPDNDFKYCFPPDDHIKFQDIYKLANDMEATNWPPGIVKGYATDKMDWINAHEDERNLLLYILSFFSGADKIVFDNINKNLMSSFKHWSIVKLYSVQCYIETVHSIVYSKLLFNIIQDKQKIEECINAIERMDSVKAKAEWAMKWMGDDVPIQMRLFAFVLVEGLLFASSFASIYHFKEQNRFPAICNSNEWIFRDENAHTLGGSLIYNHFSRHARIPVEVVNQMVEECVACEIRFATDAIKRKFIGLDLDKMSEYIRYIADCRLVGCGYPKLYNAKCALPYMLNTGLVTKSNFFEKEEHQYNMAGTLDKDGKIVFDADF